MGLHRRVCPVPSTSVQGLRLQFTFVFVKYMLPLLQKKYADYGRRYEVIITKKIRQNVFDS